MSSRCLASIACVLARAVPAAAQAPPAAAQSAAAAAWTRPTHAGRPTRSSGHLELCNAYSAERPAEFAGKEFLTERGSGRVRSSEASRDNNRDRRDGSAEADVTRAYNDFWWDRGTKVVVDQANVAGRRSAGRQDSAVDAGSPEASGRASGSAGGCVRPTARRTGRWRSAASCSVSGGAPMLPTAYNNNAQFVQTRDHVVIVNEMVHDARIIPFDGRPVSSKQRPAVARAIRAAAGKATRWSSRRRISRDKSSFRDPARTFA